MYGPNTITHILSGKAISKEIRAHFLADAALIIKLVSSFFPKLRKFMLTDEDEEDLACGNSVLENQILRADEIDELQQLYSGIDLDDFDLQSIKKSKVLDNLKSKLETKKENVTHHSRTAKLWVQYMQYVDIIKSFMRAQRQGNCRIT